jgi:predicted enzyme related to lactoylglutathione lyase
MEAIVVLDGLVQLQTTTLVSDEEGIMHIQFAELPVFDQDRAKSFYVEHFGCQIAADQPMGRNGWRWIELKFNSAETTLHFLRRDDEVPSAEPVLVLVDDDVEGTCSPTAWRSLPGRRQRPGSQRGRSRSFATARAIA